MAKVNTFVIVGIKFYGWDEWFRCVTEKENLIITDSISINDVENYVDKYDALCIEKHEKNIGKIYDVILTKDNAYAAICFKEKKYKDYIKYKHILDNVDIVAGLSSSTRMFLKDIYTST